MTGDTKHHRTHVALGQTQRGRVQLNVWQKTRPQRERHHVQTASKRVCYVSTHKQISTACAKHQTGDETT